MIRRLIRSSAAFPRFVLHDLRLSARALGSMFGALSLRSLAALDRPCVPGLHVAAYPIVGWLHRRRGRTRRRCAGDGDSRERRRARPSLDHRPVDRGFLPRFVRALGPRVDPRFARRCARACLPPALCRFRSGRSPRSASCWRRSPTSPRSGAIRIGWRSIRL